MTTPLYTKHGRRYVLWGNLEGRNWSDGDLMAVGSFRLTHCVAPGHYRYTHDVTPDTAAFLAAAEVAQLEMEQAMAEAASSSPSNGNTYTSQQQRIIERFRRDMAAAGALVPTWWNSSSAREIAQAGIDAVRRLRP